MKSLFALIVIGFAFVGCQCSGSRGDCLDTEDCEFGYCCRPLGTIDVGYCLLPDQSCDPADCVSDFDCEGGSVCCPQQPSGRACAMPMSGTGTTCGDCKTDDDCGPSAVCCATADGTRCVQGDSCGGTPGDDPPVTPIDTAMAPERPTTGAVEGAASADQSLAPIEIAIIPGDGDIVVHELLTGEVIQVLEPQPGQYAAVILSDGAAGEYMLNIGNEGALARTWTGDQFSLFGQVLYLDGAHNITDASPIGSQRPATAAILTDNTTGNIERLGYDPGVPGWTRTQTTSIPETAAGRAVSAVAPSGESPVLVAVDGAPGNLWWVDWSQSPAGLTDLGALGDAPRLIGCAPDGSVCFVPSYGSSTVTPVEINAGSPTVGTPIAVGTGPVSVSVAEVDGTVVAVTTGFGDDSLTYIVRETDGFRTETETLSDCSQPGHAVWVAGRAWILVTCNGDDSFVIRTPPAGVP